jgi:hypothetical protein
MKTPTRPASPAPAASPAPQPAGADPEADVVDKLELLALVEREARRDERGRLWAGIDHELIGLVRRILRAKAART